MSHAEPVLKFHGGAASLDSGICSGVPSGSSCHSSQSSSPAPFSVTVSAHALLRPSITRSLSHLLLEEDEEETNVDTGVPASVKPVARSASTELLLAPGPQSRAAVEAAFAGGLAQVLLGRLPQTRLDLRGPARKEGEQRPPEAPGLEACSSPSRTVAELLRRHEPAEEFFI